MYRLRGLCLALFASVLLLPGWARPERACRAADPGTPFDGSERATLPRYAIDVHLDTAGGRASVTQMVRWTNPGPEPTDRIVFHVYPRHRPTEAQRKVYERTLESFRIHPASGLDAQGRRLEVRAIHSQGTPLKFGYDAEVDTLLEVELPGPLDPGQSVEVEMAFDLDIPPVQGRFGQYLGVTNLVNWYPVVAYYGERGWYAPPYIAWHQPWVNEAGDYDVHLHLPAGEQVATGGHIVERTTDQEGLAHLRIEGRGMRDLAIVTSKRYEVHEDEVDGIAVRILAFPDHRFYARHALATVKECLSLYRQWFGPYPHPQFTLAETYLGWNGNETAGMVLIDERVFDAPHLGHVYVDQLVGHEICHQWWYATVGTDGFRESWMDEGLVCYFNDLRTRSKYGAEAVLLDWPRQCGWLPNVSFHTFAHLGYHLYRARGGEGTVLAPLPDMGHVHNLFFLAYDRGSQVVGMLHQRLGEEEFFEFLRGVYAKYQFRVLFVADFQRELEEFTGEPWGDFFEQWLCSSRLTDWSVDRVEAGSVDCGWRGTIFVSQRAEIAEPVTVEIHWAGPENPRITRVPFEPESAPYEAGGCQIARTDDDHWRIDFAGPTEPVQVIIDPDRVVLDADRQNNRWKRSPKVRLTPLMTPVDEVPLVHPLDRKSIVAGPNIDAEGRVGLRAAVIEVNRYRVSPFLAYQYDEPLLSMGVDALLWEFPWPNFTVRARYEHTLASDLYDEPVDQGILSLRWNHLYTTSFIYPNPLYSEAYVRFGDNFFPDPDVRPSQRAGIEDYRSVRAVGLAVHLDTSMPYWNPERGCRVDLQAENGFLLGGQGQSYRRVWGQAGVVHPLPECLGLLAQTRWAGRLAGGIGSPDNGEHFRFGGAERFRGQRSEDTEGNVYWLGSLEWRFPILEHLDCPLLDNLGNLRMLHGAAFYDVGESFLVGSSQGVDHAVGAGLYFQVALLSFLEQLTLRLEYGYSLRHDTSVAWFGLYRAF